MRNTSVHIEMYVILNRPTIWDIVEISTESQRTCEINRVFSSGENLFSLFAPFSLETIEILIRSNYPSVYTLPNWMNVCVCVGVSMCACVCERERGERERSIPPLGWLGASVWSPRMKLVFTQRLVSHWWM